MCETPGVETNMPSVERLTGMDWSKLTTAELLESLASPLPAPGGGSVSAVLGALGGSLVSMVALLGAQKAARDDRAEQADVGRPSEAAAGPLVGAAAQARALVATFLDLARQDTVAFLGVVNAYRLPKGAAAEKEKRRHAILESKRQATLIPLATAQKALEVMNLILEVADYSLEKARSDLGVALECAGAAVEGAVLNIEANLPGLGDATFAADMSERARSLRRLARDTYAAARRKLALTDD